MTVASLILHLSILDQDALVILVDDLKNKYDIDLVGINTDGQIELQTGMVAL